VADRTVLHVDELATADGAVGADRLHDVVGVLDAGAQLLRALRLGGLPEAERITLPELPHDRPARNRLRELHHAPFFAEAAEFKHFVVR
jgi:hypothetical protein